MMSPPLDLYPALLSHVCVSLVRLRWSSHCGVVHAHVFSMFTQSYRFTCLFVHLWFHALGEPSAACAQSSLPPLVEPSAAE